MEKVTIGFFGGALSLRVSTDQLDKLLKALPAGGWHDIEATLEALKADGTRLIDESPRTGIRSSRVAFVHPKSSGGVLTEIVQPPEVH